MYNSVYVNYLLKGSFHNKVVLVCIFRFKLKFLLIYFHNRSHPSQFIPNPKTFSPLEHLDYGEFCLYSTFILPGSVHSM